MKIRNIPIFILCFLISTNFVLAASYSSGPYGSGAYGIGYTVPASETIISGGGGGGCSYNWDCTNWFPSECPVEGIQERICANRGTCTGTNEMPNQTRICEYEHKEPLFDIFLKIFESQKICAGSKIRANVQLENYGRIELLDAFMTYWIIDENNKLISEVKDTRNVAERLDFDTLIKIPETTPAGIYRLYAQISYSGNKTAVAGESFRIMEKGSCGILYSLPGYFPFIIIGFVFLIFIIIVLFSVRKFYHIKKRDIKIKHRKLEKEEEKEEDYYTPLFR